MKLREDAPLKYHVGAHRICSTYPDETDVLFDLAEHIFRSNKRKKAWKMSDMRMKAEELKDALPGMACEESKAATKAVLASLNEAGDIFLADGSIVITAGGMSKLYEA